MLDILQIVHLTLDWIINELNIARILSIVSKSIINH